MDQELVSYLDKRFDETARRISEETARQIGTIREDLSTEIREQVGSVREQVGTVRGELRTEIRQLGVTVEALRGQIQTVAEGVITLDEKFERSLQEFRQEMRGGFEEIKSMIKFSYAELDRRIGQVEGRTRNLEARIERLEAIKT